MQASNAKQAADGAQQRLQQLQERCAAEEARLSGLQTAVLQQRQGFDAQVRSLLELGQQVGVAGRFVGALVVSLLSAYACTVYVAQSLMHTHGGAFTACTWPLRR